VPATARRPGVRRASTAALPTASIVVHPVDRPLVRRVDHVRRAQAPGQLPLRRHRIDPIRVRAGERRAHHRGQADPAEPEHRDRVAQADRDRTLNRAEAGEQGAAEQRRGLPRYVVVDHDGGCPVDHRVLAECGDPEVVVYVGAVPAQPPGTAQQRTGAVGGRALGAQRGRS
jgi:hypothetical protein